MYKKLLISALLLGSMSIATHAAQTPEQLPSDTRIKKFVYDENDVYKLDLHMKAVTVVQFAAGEVVKTMLVGDSASWEIVKLSSGNIISIKPRVSTAHTNMTVYTDKRVYTFELKTAGSMSNDPEKAAAQSFRTIFTYPKEQAVKVDKEPEKKETISGQKQGGYMVSGSSSFKPLSVYDNSLQTVFKLRKGAPRPAIFKVGSNGQEKLVNSRTNGNEIIVDGTSDFWVLRIGDEYVCVGQGRAIY